MSIVCLGWGSLIWDPRDLPVVGEWQADGPLLPVEFVRQSKDSRITLTISENAAPVTVLWIPLNVETLDEARHALMVREDIPEKYLAQSVGFWSQDRRSHHPQAASIGAWASTKAVSGVVWTALKPKFAGEQVTPSEAMVLDYLAELEGDARRRAEEYVRRTPAQIGTSYRAAIEAKLGWKTPTD